MDDFFIVDKCCDTLLFLLPKRKAFLKNDVKLQIHPKKIRLQNCKNSTDFLGVIIQPYQKYIRNRTKGNLYATIEKWNRIIIHNSGKIEADHLRKFLSSMNSYLGIITPYNTYRIHKKILTIKISDRFLEYVHFSDDFKRL